MQSEARLESGQAASRPLAELLACPPATANLLNASVGPLNLLLARRFLVKEILARDCT